MTPNVKLKLSIENTDVNAKLVKDIHKRIFPMLEKIDNADSIDYTINYKTIGRENGTIKFLPTLFNTAVGAGFDSASYDIKVYDVQPVKETRIILQSLRDNLFIDELAVEYNNLFLSSLKYVFAEQGLVDWAFKTSFIKARHNVGDLSKKITFQNDNLPSYEEYLKEVKPFGTQPDHPTTFPMISTSPSTFSWSP